MQASEDRLEQFVRLSVILTGYERLDLLGTGLAGLYLETVVAVVGDANVSNLLVVSSSVLEHFRDDPRALDAAVRAEILASPRFGPVARNIIQLWYLGSWIQLPQGWRGEFGASPADTSRVVSAEAYQQSLIYQVMRTHPPGTKQPGYGSWNKAPEPFAE